MIQFSGSLPEFRNLCENDDGTVGLISAGLEPPTAPHRGMGVGGGESSATQRREGEKMGEFRGVSRRRAFITKPKKWSWPIRELVPVLRGGQVWFLRLRWHKGWYVERVESQALPGQVVWERPVRGKRRA